MFELLAIFGSVILMSMLSFVGVISLAIGRKQLHNFLILFVAFASGSLLAAAFIHLIPEAYHSIQEKTMSYVLLGIITFFIFEKFIHWHHCGHEECHVRPVAYLNLIADGFHNFIDGVIIAAAYMVDIPLGIVTTIAIAFHEIPQEFGDFSVLLHSGMKTKKALFYNFISASMAVLGAAVGYLFLSTLESAIPYALSIAAGGLIYIATTDLMPELHKELELKKMITQTLALLMGVILLYSIFHLLPDEHGSEGNHPLEEMEGLCADMGGRWIDAYNECEWMSKQNCLDLGGIFSECESACRNNPEAVACTLNCVQVCKLENH